MTRKKVKIWHFFYFKRKSPNFNNHHRTTKCQTKFVLTLALQCYPQDLTGWVNVFGLQKGEFYRGQFVIQQCLYIDHSHSHTHYPLASLIHWVCGCDVAWFLFCSSTRCNFLHPIIDDNYNKFFVLFNK